MDKKIWTIIAIVIVILIGVGIFFYFKNSTPKEEESNYEANRTSTANTSKEEENTNNTTNSEQENTSSSEIKKNLTETENTPPPKTEEQIATFTTKIYSTDSARQNNISITCNTLNGTIVKNGETFSFCGTVGQSSSSKGYQKADIFDKNGNKKKGLGGRKLPN